MIKGNGKPSHTKQAKGISILTAFLFLSTQCLTFPAVSFAQETPGSAVTSNTTANADGITLEEQAEKQARYEAWLKEQSSKKTEDPSLDPNQDSALGGNWMDTKDAQNPSDNQDETDAEGHSYGDDGKIFTLHSEIKDEDPAIDGVQTAVNDDLDGNGLVDDRDAVLKTAASMDDGTGEIPGDINQDGLANPDDDLDGNGRIDSNDVVIWKRKTQEDLESTGTMAGTGEIPGDINQDGLANPDDDLDGNGRIDSNDVVIWQKKAQEDLKITGDINQDGVVDATDDINNDGRVDAADKAAAAADNVLKDLEDPVDLSQEEKKIASTLAHTSLRATAPAWTMYDPATSISGIPQRSRYIYASAMNLQGHVVETTLSFSSNEYRMTAEGNYGSYPAAAKIKITFVPGVSTKDVINAQLIPGHIVEVRAGESQTIRFLTNGMLQAAEEIIRPNQDDIDREKLAQLKALGAEKYASFKAAFSDLMAKVEALSGILNSIEETTQKAYAAYAGFEKSAAALESMVTNAAAEHPNVADALRVILEDLGILRKEARENINRLSYYYLNSNPALPAADAWFVDPVHMLRMRLAIVRESLHSAAAALSEAFGKLEASETLAQGEKAFEALIAAGNFNAGDLGNIDDEARRLLQVRGDIVHSLHALSEHLAVLRVKAEEIIASDKPPAEKVLEKNEFGDSGAIVILQKGDVQTVRILTGGTVAMEFEISKYEITHQTWTNGGSDQIHLMAADGRKIDLYHSYSSWNGQSYKYGSMQVMDHVTSAEYGDLNRSISYQIIKGHLRQTSTSLMLPGDDTGFYMDAAGSTNGRGGRMIQSTSAYYDWQTGKPMGKGIYVTRTDDAGVTSWLSYSNYNGQQYLSYGSYSPGGKYEYESFQINDLWTDGEEGSDVIQRVRAPGIASFSITRSGITLNRCDPYGSTVPDHCGEV